MAQGAFDYQIVIHAPRARVFEEYSHPERQVGLHPMMKTVRDVTETLDDQGRTVRGFWYDEYVNILGPLRLYNKVVTRMTLVKPNEDLLLEATSAMNIKAHVAFHFQDEPDGSTRIIEHASYDTPRLVVAFTTSTAKKAHELMLNNLKIRLEKGD